MKFGEFVKIPGNFLKKIILHRRMILAMTLREIQNRYAGSLGGMLWSIINPLMTILVFWFVFSVGFKVSPMGDIPFIVLFLCGLIPWMLFNDALMGSSSSVLGNPHLVTKTVFPTEILPIVIILASMFTHFFLLAVLLGVLWANDIPISFFSFQFFYYLLGLSVFSMGLAWIVAAFNVFYRDVGQILGVILNAWFWLTPIVWMMDMIPAQYHPLLNLNPIKHVVDGYKNSFIYFVPFWTNFREELLFWAVSILVFILGGIIFKNLKSEFAEVL